MTGWTRETSHGRARLVALLTGLLVLVAGCSASGGESGSGSVAGGQGAAAQSQQDAAGTTGDGSGSGSSTATDRQVVTTGTLTLLTEHPTSTVEDVVALVEKAGGRVDARAEQAGSADDPGTAELTVRVPSDQVSAVIDALRGLGTVSTLELTTNDVTAAAQDLDARIGAQRISVARMEDVLAHATTTADIMAAEEAVRQRQSDLEAMVAERGRMADQVALSTLTLTLSAPAVVEHSGPRSFPAALATGWRSLVSGLSAFALVLGVVLPWLAFLAVIVVPLVVLGRRRSQRRAAQAAASPVPAAPATAGTPPAAPPLGPFSL